MSLPGAVLEAVTDWLGKIIASSKTMNELERKVREMHAALKDMGEAGIVPTRETIARAQERLAAGRKEQAERAKARRAALKG